MKTLLLTIQNRYLNLIVSVGFALLLLFIRMRITHSTFYIFLVWNLFLAAVPYMLTQMVSLKPELFMKKGLAVFSFSLWLLFLPNSPYIITDLIHLHDDRSGLVWFDLFLVFVFACNGLLLGLLSLLDMRQLLNLKFSRPATMAVLLIACTLSGYGIFLGRFLRFNSWDILTKPFILYNGIFHSLLEPKVWAITFSFGGFFYILFMLFQAIDRKV